MDLTNSVVVGLDGSAHARTAADWAADRAAERGWELVLMAVHGTVAAERRAAPVVWNWPGPEERRQQVDIILDEAAAELAVRHPELVIEKLVVTGDPVRALVQASSDAALVAIGTRRLGGIVGRVLGSVADAAVARAEGPIAVIPPEYEPGDGPIVLGFDLALAPMAAARFAFDAARASGRPLAIATVEDPARPLELIAAPPDDATELPGVAEHEAEVEETLEVLRKEYPDVALTIAMIPGATVASLLKFGADADLLVVGTRGRSELVGLLFGSVSRAVLRRAEGPAVVVPEPH